MDDKMNYAIQVLQNARGIVVNELSIAKAMQSAVLPEYAHHYDTPIRCYIRKLDDIDKAVKKLEAEDEEKELD